MNRQNIIAGIIAIVIIVGGFLFVRSRTSGLAQPIAPETENAKNEEQVVREIAIDFGSKMKNVLLTEPKSEQVKMIRENYADLISADLMTAFMSDPIKAPGRLNASKWPDRIEILEITKDEEAAYEVQARVIEVNDAGPVSQYGIALKLRNRDGKWLITGFSKAILN